PHERRRSRSPRPHARGRRPTRERQAPSAPPAPAPRRERESRATETAGSCVDSANDLKQGRIVTLLDETHDPKDCRSRLRTYATRAVRSFLWAEPIMLRYPVEADVLAPERNPAVQVADRGSAIRITGVRGYWVNPVVYVRIETNQGVVGWGDLKGVDPR